MPFLQDTPLTVQPIDAQRWRLVHPLVYAGERDVFTVPAGEVTDLASVPRALTALIPRYGAYTRAAVLHDYLCARVRMGVPVVSRCDADGLFRRVLRESDVVLPLRWAMWAAVRAGSRMSDATVRDWAAFVAVAVLAVPFYAVPALVVQVWLILQVLVGAAARAAGSRA